MFYRSSELWLRSPLFFFWTLELCLVSLWTILSPGFQCKSRTLRHVGSMPTLPDPCPLILCPPFPYLHQALYPCILDFLLISPSLRLWILAHYHLAAFLFLRCRECAGWECCSSRLSLLWSSPDVTLRDTVCLRDCRERCLTLCLFPFSHISLPSFLKQKGQRPCGIAGSALGMGRFVDLQFFCLLVRSVISDTLGLNSFFSS